MPRTRAMLRDESVAETERCLEPRAMLRTGTMLGALNDASRRERCLEKERRLESRANVWSRERCLELKAILENNSDAWVEKRS